jgi:hypothetical protein
MHVFFSFSSFMAIYVYETTYLSSLCLGFNITNSSKGGKKPENRDSNSYEAWETGLFMEGLNQFVRNYWCFCMRTSCYVVDILDCVAQYRNRTSIIRSFIRLMYLFFQYCAGPEFSAAQLLFKHVFEVESWRKVAWVKVYIFISLPWKVSRPLMHSSDLTSIHRH